MPRSRSTARAFCHASIPSRMDEQMRLSKRYRSTRPIATSRTWEPNMLTSCRWSQVVHARFRARNLGRALISSEMAVKVSSSTLLSSRLPRGNRQVAIRSPQGASSHWASGGPCGLPSLTLSNSNHLALSRSVSTRRRSSRSRFRRRHSGVNVRFEYRGVHLPVGKRLMLKSSLKSLEGLIEPTEGVCALGVQSQIAKVLHELHTVDVEI